MTRRLSAADWHALGVARGVRSAGDSHRWERCVDHRGEEVREFAERHFGEPHRRLLLVGGAGFDPRALHVARFLASIAGKRIRGLFLRERRPTPDRSQLAIAERQLDELKAVIPDAEVVDVEVFESDGAVSLGRSAVSILQDRDLRRFSDVLVDFSALSIGASFPVTKFLFALVEGLSGDPQGSRVNLHALVTASSRTDDCIVVQPSDKVGPVHGFRGRLEIDETARAAKLWIPQLQLGLKATLERIYAHLSDSPHDIVPVLPFPAEDPRLGDRLLDHYREELDDRWQVDSRSIVYAAESDPLDFYRKVLRIDDERCRVFASTGGSLVVLSPVGTKVLALGALMAALERDLPVLYVEARGFATRLDEGSPHEYTEADLVHVWLLGEAYPPPARMGTSATSIGSSDPPPSLHD